MAENELKAYKVRNNKRRDEDDPALREAVDDIYRLLGFLETHPITVAPDACSAGVNAQAAAEELDRLALLRDSSGIPMTDEQLQPVIDAISNCGAASVPQPATDDDVDLLWCSGCYKYLDDEHPCTCTQPTEEGE